MDKESIKILIHRHLNLLSAVYRLFGCNRVCGRRGNKVIMKGAFLKRCRIEFRGVGNTVEIESGLTRLKDCRINVYGTGCKVLIGVDSNLVSTVLHLEDKGSSIVIGKHAAFERNIELSAIEGCGIEIGEDCLFADAISFRTGDSHSLLDRETGARINPSKDIQLGDHVWVGQGVKVLKGAEIGGHSVVAAGAIVTGKKFPEYAVIGGCPAKVLKESIDWTSERI